MKCERKMLSDIFNCGQSCHFMPSGSDVWHKASRAFVQKNCFKMIQYRAATVMTEVSHFQIERAYREKVKWLK